MSFFSSLFKKKIIKTALGHYCSAVVVAAGSSTRMGEDKLSINLLGIPVLVRTLSALQSCPDIDEIIVVTSSEKIPETARLCNEYEITKTTKILVGGQTRAESVLAGVSEINSRATLAAIHDGARPLVTPALISRVIHAAALYNAAAPAVRPKDTIKSASDNIVTSTPNRSNVFAVQTPQVFIPELIKAALTKAVLDGWNITDDCSAVERMGFEVRLVEGDEQNIKLTSPQDLALLTYFLKVRGE